MAPAARAVRIASVDHRRRALARAGPAGAEPDPGDHRRTALGGDRGGQRGQALAQHLLPGDLGVPVARALLGVAEHRPQQRVDVDEAPARRSRAADRCAATRLTRWARSTDASCRVWPWVNSRRNWPSVAGAYTPPNSRGIPPERITSRSSMLSAPAAIPAMIEVSFPAGFAPAEATLDVLNLTRCRDQLRQARPARPTPSAGPGPRTTRDSRHRRPVWPATSHQVASLSVPSADWLDQELDTPDSPSPEGTSTSRPAEPASYPSTDSRLSDRRGRAWCTRASRQAPGRRRDLACFRR